MNWPECIFYCVAAICVASVLTTIFKGIFGFHERLEGDNNDDAD